MRRTVLRALALGASGLLVAGSGAAQTPRAQIERWVPGWEGRPPLAIHADNRGPYWARRSGPDVVLERISAGRSQELRRVRAPIGHPDFAFVPDLVRTSVVPELLYRESFLLRSDLEPRHAEAVGEAAWEYYSAAREGSRLFSAAFGILDDGFSYVTLVDGFAPPVVAELRPYVQGVWSPEALVQGNRATVVFRGVMPAPGRGYGIQVESMDLGAFQASKRWQPSRSSFQPSETGVSFGDPAACVDDAGNVHWAAVIWSNRTFQPTGRIVVDGVELAQRGFAGNVDWLPDLGWVRGRGLVLAIAGASGSAQVGEVHGNQFVPLADLPSVAPAFAQPPPTHLAVFGESFYVTTSEGLWAYHIPIPVPAQVGLALLAAILVAAWTRRYCWTSRG